MSATIRYHLHGAESRFNDQLTAEEVLEARRRSVEHEFPGGLQFLLRDYSGITGGDLQTLDLRHCAEADRALCAQSPGVRIAVVAPQDMMFGLARMWHGFLGASSSSAVVVRSRAQALDWLREHGCNEGLPEE